MNGRRQCPAMRRVAQEATCLVESLWVWQLCLENVGCDRIDPFALVATTLAHHDPEVQRAAFDAAYAEACDLLNVGRHAPIARPFDDAGDNGGVLPDELLPWIAKAREYHTTQVRPLLEAEALKAEGARTLLGH